MGRFAYAKIGRSMPIPSGKWADDGVDTEAAILLGKLSRRYPEHEFVIVGRNSGEDPREHGYPANVTNAWTDDIRAEAKIVCRNGTAQEVHDGLTSITRHMFTDVDGIIYWAGQHGTSNAPIPKVDDPLQLTNPQISFINYAGFLIKGINDWRDGDPMNRRETWICPDARNFLKCRDLKWPPATVLSLYDWSKQEKHYRYGDPYGPQEWGYEQSDAEWSAPGIWIAKHRYEYAQVEFTNLPTEVAFDDTWAHRQHFGIIINEARAYVKLNRLAAMRDWVLPLNPAFVHGKWTDKAKAELGVNWKPLPWQQMWAELRSVKCTFTTPSSGAGWASTKPWEAFAAGTVCFFHPGYDDQGHIVPTLKQVRSGAWDHDPEHKALGEWLRPDTPEQLAARVAQLNQDEDTWRWLVQAQRRLFDRANAESLIIRRIDERCGLTPVEAP